MIYSSSSIYAWNNRGDSFFYLKRHLAFVGRALEKGLNVIGYLWWSLIDNFEWEKGFAAKFGLVSVDENLNRSIKPFAKVYKQICARNRIEYA